MISFSHRIAYIATAAALAFVAPAKAEELTQCYTLDERLQNSVNTGETIDALVLMSIPADKVSKFVGVLISTFGPPPAHWHIEDVTEVYLFTNAITGGTSLVFNDKDGCSWTRGLNVRDPRVLEALLQEAGIDFKKELIPGIKSFPDIIKEKGIVKKLDKTNTF